MATDIKDSSATKSAVVGDHVVIVITQLYCPQGHNLVGLGATEDFDAYPSVNMKVSDGSTEGTVHLSPLFGDPRKTGQTFELGTKLSLTCPECDTAFPELTACHCSERARLRKLFLTPDRADSQIVAVCDIWGCTRSRIIDSVEMLNEFLAGEIGPP